MPGALDLTAGLRSLQIEVGQEKPLVPRSRALMLHAGAHCVFFCKLLHCTWQRLQSNPFTAPRVQPGRQGLHVGIIGGGHLGKQLVHCFITLAGIRPQNIQVSTRRPETLRSEQDLGVECFYDNQRLVRWAQVVFLCCLPSQLPAVCADISGHLGESCVVYSLVCAVPIARLERLLSHGNVVRPEYRSEDGTEAQEWNQHCTLTEALADRSFEKATNPAERPGVIRLVSRFLEPVLYSVLNMCTTCSLTSGQSLCVLNDMIQQLYTHQAPLFVQEGRDQGPLMVQEGQNQGTLMVQEGRDQGRLMVQEDGDQGLLITARHVVREELVALQDQDRPFPWFDLCYVQTNETPLSLHLASCEPLWDRLSHVYSNVCRVPVSS